MKPLADDEVSREIRLWARKVERSTASQSQALTIADASTKSGLALKEAEKALNFLLNEFRGRLAVGEEGDLVYQFPHGYTKPWQTQESFREMMVRLGKVLMPVLKVAVKIWILFVIVVYVTLFLLLLLGIMFAGKGKGDDRRRSSFGGSYVLFRLLFELIYDATWSIFMFGPSSRRPRLKKRSDRKLYEEVFSFIFGPEGEPGFNLFDRARILAYIRQHAGRIVVGDIVALTDCSIAEGEQFLTKLMNDFEGDVSVDDNGAIIFSFPELRKTATAELSTEVLPCWKHGERVAPLTGNKSTANALIIALNGFNLVMSSVAMWFHITLTNIPAILSGTPLGQLPDQSTAIFLGIFPFLFSMLLFAIPAGRWFLLKKKRIQAALANASRALLREVFGMKKFQLPYEEAFQSYVSHAKTADTRANLLDPGISSAELARAFENRLLDLESTLEINDSGEKFCEFQRFAQEQTSVLAARKEAPRDEKDIGPLVY